MSIAPDQMDAAAISDPGLFLAMEDLELVARGVVEGALHGLHRSPYIGFSAEFDAHREYEPGDDLRYVNWNLWARTDRLYIKQFKSDTNLNLYVLLDASRSMLCENGPCAKWTYAARAAAALAWLSLRSRDSAGVFLLSDGIKEYVPPRVRADQFREIQAVLTRTPAVAGGTNLGQSLEEALHLCRRRGIVVILSDLFDEDEEVLRSIDTLRFYGHEVLVVQILDPWEHELPDSGQYEFHDLETGETLQTNAPAIRRSCREAVEAWRKGMTRRFDESGVDWLTCTTADPLADLLINYILRRAEMY
jgi:uncharacterized protein (DUF58 family)